MKSVNSEDIYIAKEDVLLVSLLKFFITNCGYAPIILHGIDSEIWIENLHAEYKIIRLVTSKMINEEQIEFDKLKTKRIVKSLKAKTFTPGIKTLSIVLCNEEKFDSDDKSNTYVFIDDFTDIYESECLKSHFDGIENIKEISNKDDVEHELHILQSDIEKHTFVQGNKFNDLFEEKPYVFSSIVPFLMIVVYVLMLINNNTYDKNALLLSNINPYDAITSFFVSNGLPCLISSIFSFTYIMKMTEVLRKKSEILLMMLAVGFATILGAITLNLDMLYSMDYITVAFISAFAYYGYYYRVFFVKTYQNTLVPSLMFLSLNVIFGYTNLGLLLISATYGLLFSMMFGVRFKDTHNDRINGLIMTIIFTLFLILLIR